ncbi:hypothetical protein [Microbispora sp. KK1-11]|uniref:hypothetical protein n=1 Tax=Microbispora sp. KK1-11 TaxID=2053005 RepID=UPI00163BE1EC|nr:hypothetical protein [Microbispora sp. KK1-11]
MRGYAPQPVRAGPGRGRATRAVRPARPSVRHAVPVGELGSTVVVTPGAWRERAGEIARGPAASFTLGSGQFCTKPGAVLVPDAAALAAALPPLTSGRMLTPETAGRFHRSLAEPTAEPGVEISLRDDARGPRLVDGRRTG